MDLMTPLLLEKINKYIKDDEPWRFYKLSEWRKLRAIARRRDHNECQVCKEEGKHSRAEAVHHIIEMRDNTNLSLKLNNLICLCASCHNKEHDRMFYAKKKFKNPERW